MIFYLIPPRNQLELTEFNQHGSSRFHYFLGTTVEQNYETLNLHADVDQIEHFILRCFCAYKPEIKDWILARETDLFRLRLNAMPWEEKQNSSRDLMKQISRLQKYKTQNPITTSTEMPYLGELLLTTLNNMCEALLISKISDHLNADCENNCKRYFQKVPFQMCISLVRNRSVVIQKGFAFVPCSMWNSLLVELFTHHYEFGLLMITNSILTQLRSDARWTLLFDQLGKRYDSFKQSGLPLDQKHLTAKQIDGEKRYFPPCMAHLLTVLRTHHRLSHNWRFRFSLFLKDIGMNVDESIEFWKNEYSKSCTAESSCTHSWQTNYRKYMYNIRHLYGLVGFSKKNEIKSCAVYQDMTLGMREEGGCPFVHFDEINLVNALPSEISDNSEVINEIFRLKSDKNPQQACYVYRSACAKKYRLQIPTERFKSPVEYYQSMKLCMNSYLDW